VNFGGNLISGTKRRNVCKRLTESFRHRMSNSLLILSSFRVSFRWVFSNYEFSFCCLFHAVSSDVKACQIYLYYTVIMLGRTYLSLFTVIMYARTYLSLFTVIMIKLFIEIGTYFSKL